ncbi:hypothetical protein JCM33374_g6080 [Metschnikowia sp. JCM 33374]|nr:hypothetical protein JCM33374_g6080 [Metschnikowia sp. JCM 33374]
MGFELIATKLKSDLSYIERLSERAALPEDFLVRLDVAKNMYRSMMEACGGLQYYTNWVGVEKESVVGLMQLNIRLFILTDSNGNAVSQIRDYTCKVYGFAEVLRFWNKQWLTLTEVSPFSQFMFQSQNRLAEESIEKLFSSISESPQSKG